MLKAVEYSLDVRLTGDAILLRVFLVEKSFHLVNEIREAFLQQHNPSIQLYGPSLTVLLESDGRECSQWMDSSSMRESSAARWEVASQVDVLLALAWL